MQERDLIEHGATQTLFGALFTRVPTNATQYYIQLLEVSANPKSVQGVSFGIVPLQTLRAQLASEIAMGAC